MNDNKPPLDELAHFGVKGMKWGIRKKVSSGEVHAARRRMGKRNAEINREVDQTLVYTKRGTPERAAKVKAIREMRTSMLKNPDRLTASRMTLGEKIAAGLLASTGAGLPAVAAAVTAQQAYSRRIQYKQETGAYDKKK